MLSSTYVPTLGENSGRETRKTYGNGRFKFPQNYENDQNIGNVGGYGYNDNRSESDEEEDEDREGEGEGEGEEEDNSYNIVSIIANEIFQQKKKERDAETERILRFREKTENEELFRIQRIKDLESVALEEIENELREDVRNEYEDETFESMESVKEKEKERGGESGGERGGGRGGERERDRGTGGERGERGERERSMERERVRSSLRNRDRERKRDRERERGGEGGKEGEGEKEGEEEDDETPQHFWDTLLSKSLPTAPLGSGIRDSRDSRDGSRFSEDIIENIRLSHGASLLFVAFHFNFI